MNPIYVFYRGDSPIFVGYVDECMRFFGYSRKDVQWYASPFAKNRADRTPGSSMLLAERIYL